MSAVADAGIATELTAARALAIFGGLALLLAAVGLYGVMARLVAGPLARTRCAHRARRRARPVRRLVLARTMRIAAGGVVAGASASLVLSRQLGAQLLHGVATMDPVVFAAAAAVLVTWRCWRATSRRAGHPSIDPITVMKSD